MNTQNEQHHRKELKFQKRFITFPFLGFALIIAILNIVFPDITVMVTLFGLFSFIMLRFYSLFLFIILNG